MSNKGGEGHYGSWDYDAFFHRGSEGHEQRSQHNDSQRDHQRYDHRDRYDHQEMYDSFDLRDFDMRSYHDSRGGGGDYNRHDDYNRRGESYNFGLTGYEGSRGGGYDGREGRSFDNRGGYDSSSREYDHYREGYGSRGYDQSRDSYRSSEGYDRRGEYGSGGAYNGRSHEDSDGWLVAGASRGYSGGDRGYNDRAHEDNDGWLVAGVSRGGLGGGDRGRSGGDRGYNDRSHEDNDGWLVAGVSRGGLGGGDRGYSGGDRGYGHRGHEDRGYGGDREVRQVRDRRDDHREDRGYGRRDDHRGGDHRRGGGRGDDRGYGGVGRDGGRGRGRGGGRGGRRGDRGRVTVATGPGSGSITGSGYENIGSPITDPKLIEEWTGRAGERNVNPDDADLQQNVFICRRPDVGRGGKHIDVQVNYFSVSLNAAPVEIFKYHVLVERETDVEFSDVGQPPRLSRSLVRKVIDAALRQYQSEFGGICVVHDSVAAIYVPSRLQWDSKTFANINPDDFQPTPSASGSNHRTFSMTIKLVEAIVTGTLADYYKNPDVNIMPVLQALNVVACHLGAQRLTNIGRSFFSMRNPTPLTGGKELCWGYHQAIRIGDCKLLMNVDQKATVFYTPGELMGLVLPMVDPQSVNDTRGLSDRDKRKLESVLKRLEVVPIHRKGWKRAIYGISEQPANQTMVDIRGEHMSVTDYFLKSYNVTLRYPYLPLVNVGRREVGKETWLPIELCKVAPGQRSKNVTDVDTAEILKQTGQPPRARQINTKNQVQQAGFENDPYQAAFGMKVDQNFVEIKARVMDPPEVQFSNVSVRPPNGQWDLHRFVQGVTLRNWGVVVTANVTEREVKKFIGVLVDIAGKSSLMIEDRQPYMIHKNQFRGVQIKELMTKCLADLEGRHKGPPQLIMVVMEETSDEEFREINYTSDTVLGILNQCILAENVRDAKPSICRNLSLQINSRLGGKNSILREPLPLVSTAPTIVIGADVEHPRPGMGSRPSIAAVVASMDRYSAKYIARVAAQTAANDIHHLPHILRDLVLAFFKNTNRKPEHVIYYRNGVDEGRFHDILEAEMRSLRMAFKMISDDYNPPVTFIVVNKRHHTRAAFLENDRNMAPGTVIDTGIVDSHRFDFFLYGHNGPLGTSVPCHYTVLHDENKMSAEDIQRLTYFLCFTCARCAKSVSCAAPVYYAELVSERARLYLNEESYNSFAEGSFTSNFDFADLHENLKDSMYFI
ncbi:Protein argonaute-2 [Phytophthora citrophthora]|uniref:Protein argonaute-2 n=1 Tax=Phytophthora citrophthora TaxID=4793 RepID=A0AAD9GTD0_9STRA|nr:Protein argonaute-2 [Phytophthora citrophthora]